jgi:hypothetical protein
MRELPLAEISRRTKRSNIMGAQSVLDSYRSLNSGCKNIEDMMGFFSMTPVCVISAPLRALIGIVQMVAGAVLGFVALCGHADAQRRYHAASYMDKETEADNLTKWTLLRQMSGEHLKHGICNLFRSTLETASLGLLAIPAILVMATTDKKGPFMTYSSQNYLPVIPVSIPKDTSNGASSYSAGSAYNGGNF